MRVVVLDLDGVIRHFDSPISARSNRLRSGRCDFGVRKPAAIRV